MPKIILNRHAIEIGNLDKIFFPKSKITKGDLIEYYKKNASIILHHCKNRPLVMLRFPNGITSEPFYQKNAGEYFPSWIKTINIKSRSIEGSKNFVVCNNAATLVYIANQACITPHLWLSRIDKLDYPDLLIFDLDPYSGKPSEFKLVCKVALLLKQVLEDCGLICFVMTTGSHGLHVRVPIKRDSDFAFVREFAKSVTEKIIEKYPEEVTLQSRKERRKNKVLVDIMRNSYGATAVAPYAIRAHEKAPVATPLEWDEIRSKTLTSQKYNIQNIFARLSKKGDIWSKMQQSAKSLKKAQKHL